MGNDAYERSPEGMLATMKARIDDLDTRLVLASRPALSRMGQELSDWNDAVTTGFYWSTQTAANKPTGTSWISGFVLRNNMEGFERVVQEVVQPSTVLEVGLLTWRRIGFPNGSGGWSWGVWYFVGECRGTTAQRDSFFGVPATDAARVALANRKIRWFNVDTGWEEMYYTTTGLSGLTARGLEAGIPSGWYPTGEGPKIVLNPGGAVVASVGSNIGGWSNTTWHRGGTAFLDYEGDGVVRVKLAGRYHIHWRSATQTGGGELDLWFYVGSTFANDAWELNATRFKTHEFTYGDVRVTANDTVRAYINAGTANVHMSSSSQFGEFLVEYIGPRLVSA